ncbi:hypothetical protein LA080_013795 [Diaporthe eres]|nr:hypothetical protein LA080_013795 [Diaporthe eres]
MPLIIFNAGRSALAILIIFFIAGTRSLQNLQPKTTHLHQAFWCSVIDTAVWCPIEVITYFTRSNRRIQPRVLQKLEPLISFLWCEMTVHIVSQSVQPFIVHASLSPSLTEASAIINAPKPDPWGTLAQVVLLLCALQIIHSASLCVRCVQGMFKSHADLDVPNVDPKDVPMTCFHVLAAAHGCVDHLFVTAALYIECIAAGTLVTSFKLAGENRDGSLDWMFTATAGTLLAGAHAYESWRAMGWVELMPDRRGGRRFRRQTMREGMLNRLCLRYFWVSEAWLRSVMPWRVPRLLRRWSCPELAALWPEGELQQNYVEWQAEFPPLARLAPWSNSIRHVDQWRTAGLTRDYAPRDYSAIPARGPPGWLGQLCYVVLGRIIWALVCFLEVAFAWFLSLALLFAWVYWREERKARLKLRRA